MLEHTQIDPGTNTLEFVRHLRIQLGQAVAPSRSDPFVANLPLGVVPTSNQDHDRADHAKVLRAEEQAVDRAPQPPVSRMIEPHLAIDSHVEEAISQRKQLVPEDVVPIAPVERYDVEPQR